MFYVYILTVKKPFRAEFYYTGQTDNLERRIAQHRAGTGARCCRGAMYMELERVERFNTRQAAVKREREIKGYSRAQKRELILSDGI